MDWKEYEKEIHEAFLEMYPDAVISHDVKLPGILSKVDRQIDILIEDDVAGFSIKIAIEAKCFSRKIDVKHVETFLSMMEDIGVDQGLMITNVGFSKAALNRAHFGAQRLELDILNLDPLGPFQSDVALPYVGHNMLIVQNPFGWIIESNKQETGLAYLFQRGKNLEQAQKDNEWMYINLWNKVKKVSSIEELLQMQKVEMEEFYENVIITEKTPPRRKDHRSTYVRIATAEEIPGQELTGFIEFEDSIAFFVCFSPNQSEAKNLRKLSYLLKYTELVQVEFKNSQVIQQLEKEIKTMNGSQQRSEAYRQISIWYLEMRCEQEELRYRRLSYREYPSNYRNILRLIFCELRNGTFEMAVKCSIGFFSMAPANPQVMQDLLNIYVDSEWSDQFIETVSRLEGQYQTNVEAMANISYHYGLFLLENEEKSLAVEKLQAAKEYFEEFDKNHYALSELEKLLIKHS